MKKVDFNGYSFREPKMRAAMRYLIIKEGDLDINNAYAFQSKKELLEYIKTSGDSLREILAIFEIKEFVQKKQKKPRCPKIN